MRKYIILTLLLLFSFYQIFSQVTCDVFNLKTDIENNNLSISLDTDLPDNTILMLSVYRSYWEKGNSEEYSIKYYSEKSTIKEWRNQKKISIDNSKWEINLQNKQKELTSIGLGFDVEKINDSITIRAIIPAFQPNTMFGNENSKLTGKKVDTSFLPTVEDEINIFNPLNESLQKKSPFANPLSLKIGESCFVSKETPLMPEFAPSSPLLALDRVKYISKGGLIKIMSVKGKGNLPWYEVEAYDSNGNMIGKGWINSQALMYQNLRLNE